MTRLAPLVAMAIVALVSSLPLRAGFEFQILQTGSYVADLVNPTTGSFDVILKLTNGEVAPSDIGSYNVAFDSVSPNITITSVTNVAPPVGLMSGLIVTTGTTPTKIRLGNDLGGGTASQLDVADAVLARVNFSVAAGQSGTFNFTGVQNATQLLDNLAINDYGAVAISGSIVVSSISAVPEPATTGLIGLALVGAAGAVRKRFSRRK